jgi:hypothetical protein
MKKLLLKSFVLALFSASVLTANAQSFSVSLNLPASSLTHSRSRLLTDGSVVSVLYDANTLASHVVMINANGTTNWAKSYLGIKIDEVQQLPSGNLAFAGTKDYYYSVWGILDQNGNQIWAKQLYTTDANYDLASLDVLANGKLLYNFSKYSRSVTIRCDEGGNTEDCDEGEDTLGMGKNPCFDSFGCDDSGYVSCDKSDDRMMIIRHNSNGDVIWAKNYMKASSEYFHLKKIKQLADGSFMAVGLVSPAYTSANNSGFIAKMDANGEILWTKKYPLPPNPGYFSSTFRSFEIEEGFVYISGYYTTDQLNMQNFLMKMDENGEVISSKQILVSNNALDWSTIPTMSSVTFEHDMKDHHLVYNNYSFNEGLRDIEINKVDFDGVLGCEVVDFPVTAISYAAFTYTQPANYGQTSILETAPENITSVALTITPSTIGGTNSCASVSGIDDLHALNLSVYPNPASEFLNISGLSSDKNYMIQVIDLTGKIVQINKGINGVEMTTISVVGISTGSYLINITDLSSNTSTQLKWMKM